MPVKSVRWSFEGILQRMSGHVLQDQRDTADFQVRQFVLGNVSRPISFRILEG